MKSCIRKVIIVIIIIDLFIVDTAKVTIIVLIKTNII